MNMNLFKGCTEEEVEKYLKYLKLTIKYSHPFFGSGPHLYLPSRAQERLMVICFPKYVNLALDEMRYLMAISPSTPALR